MTDNSSPRVLTESELRQMMREEFKPMETTLQRIDLALRGTTDGQTPGLNGRVASLESSRRSARKLWAAVLAVVVSAFGAIAAKVIGDKPDNKPGQGSHYESRQVE